MIVKTVVLKFETVKVNAPHIADSQTVTQSNCEHKKQRKHTKLTVVMAEYL